MGNGSVNLVMAFQRVTELADQECRAILQRCNGDLGQAFEEMTLLGWFSWMEPDEGRRLKSELTRLVEEQARFT